MISGDYVKVAKLGSLENAIIAIFFSVDYTFAIQELKNR